MKKSDVTYIVGSVFLAFTSLFYCATIWFSIQVPRYYPLEHTWKWTKEAGVPSQGWYGMQAFAFLAAGVVALLVYATLQLTARSGARLNAGTTKVIALVVMLVVVPCMGYLLYHEFAKWGVFPG